jgi:RNA polymerase sigma factor FliA
VAGVQERTIPARARSAAHPVLAAGQVRGEPRRGRSPPSVEQADLVAYGISGLIDALENFDPTRGIKFETYAIPRIRGAIIDELRSLDWVPRSVRFKAREIEKATAELEARLKRPPTDAEIAEHLGIPIGELHEILTQISSVKAFLPNFTTGPEAKPESPVQSIPYPSGRSLSSGFTTSKA